MFGHDYKMKISQVKPLHDGTTVDRNWCVEDNGTGERAKSKDAFSANSGGAPFHAAVKFRFDIGNSGIPEKGNGPTVNRNK